ncbi:MAG: carbamoyltransferase HypF, partial [Gammaproteobacteria bacterium]|nr:carbamoyltransferase HypF [Gammaproteobacteria bacterium]
MADESHRIRVSGQVQGVGFRPFVYRLAHQYGLTGSVCNQMGQVEIVVQGSASAIQQFLDSLVHQAPNIAHPELISNQAISLSPQPDFIILPSQHQGKASIHVPPDYFTCPDCLAELHDPQNRRYAYPFINCTQCGPRYTLIECLPYDRPNTSMAGFTLCPACQQEYTDPLDRRFHAEPIACALCGPEIRYHASGKNQTLETGDAALQEALHTLRAGQIVAVKGIGGYHLMCDARDQQAVQRLRRRKNRPDKPLAVLFAADDAQPPADLVHSVELDDITWRTLKSPARPIVLAPKHPDNTLAEAIAPGLNEIGVMLAYSPLHDLLLQLFKAPLVATSGNLSGEPVITSSHMAQQCLAPIADGFLHHNRPIVRPADDSVIRVIADKPRTLRLGRGTTPLELDLPAPLAEPVLALGGHMKATIALAWDQHLVVSPHIGEMESPRSLAVFEQLIEDLQSLFGVTAQRFLCDAHPGYASHRWAKNQTRPVTTIWHHHAHAASLFAEQNTTEMDAPILAFTWDGVGWGPDQTLWGGE